MVDLTALWVTIPILVLALAVALRGRDMTASAAVAVLGAGFAVLVGAIGGGPAADEIYDIAPTVAFLAALLVLSHLADAEGVFAWAAAVLADRSGGSSIALFGRVFVLAALTTAVLSLDATVLLLTPVVIATVRRMRFPARPHAYACGHLANSASLLMPVSNLTNLLAFAATGLSFLSFTALMALPWLVAISVEYALLRRVVSADLTVATGELAVQQPPVPRLGLSVVAMTVAGFAISSLVGFAPIWAAVGGALILALRRVLARTSTMFDIIEAANLPFALFIGGLAVIVRGIQENGLGVLISALLPDGQSLGALLAVAGIAAVLANVVNNLPATLAMLPAAAVIGTPAILAVLIGVNIGANLSYVGSLANLLWRRVLGPSGEAPTASDFTKVGLLTVPLTLVATTTALWISVRLFG